MFCGDDGCEHSGLGLALVIFPQNHLGSRVGPGHAPPVLGAQVNPQGRAGPNQTWLRAGVTGVACMRPVRPVRARVLPMWHRVRREVLPGPGTSQVYDRCSLRRLQKPRPLPLQTPPLAARRRLAHARNRPGAAGENFIPQKPPRSKVSLKTRFGVRWPWTVQNSAWAAQL